jgi:hypothetical protein
MQKLFLDALPFTGITCFFALLLCLAPLWGTKTRTTIGVLFLLIAVGFTADVLITDHTGIHTLEVPNFLKRAGEKEPHRWVTAVVEAPAWRWHVFMTLLMAIPGTLLLLRRRRVPAVPVPVLHFWLVFVFFFVARLGLEKSGAPVEIVWGVGVTAPLLVMLPFFGFYCGRHGYTFVRFLVMLLLGGLLQRMVVAGWAWLATTEQLGTHLDTHGVTDIELPILGERKLTDAYEQWLWGTAVLHLVFWQVTTVVAGVVLGGLPYWWGKRRADAAVIPAVPDAADAAVP